MTIVDILSFIGTLGLWAVLCFITLLLIPMDDKHDDSDKTDSNT